LISIFPNDSWEQRGWFMEKKKIFLISVLVAIFLGALCIRLHTNFKQRLLLGIDSPYYLIETDYLLNNWPSLPDPAPPVVFHVLAGLHGILSPFGTSLMTSLKIGSALISAIVAFTVYLMTKQLTKNWTTALVAAFLAAFVHANVRIFQDLWKNALAVSLAPLSVFFFHKGTETHRRRDFLIAGILLGVVAATHELVACALAIAYLSYVGFLIGCRMRLPWPETKSTLITFAAVIPFGGIYILINRGAIETVGHVSPFFGEALPSQINIYSELIGPLLLVLAIVGAGVVLYRKKAADILMASWALSAVILAQPWVSTAYLWRFALVQGTPLALLASVGIVDGIGAFLRRFKKRHLVFLGLISAIVIYQTHSAYVYAMRFHPTISDQEYDAFVELHGQLGDGAYLISEFGHYWIDAVGMRNLRDERALRVLRAPDDIRAATGLYWLQEEVGENLYVHVNPFDRRINPQKFESPLFKLIFSRPFMKIYALSDNFTPPGESRPPPPPREPPKQDYLTLLRSNPLRIFIFPIDLANCYLSGFWSSALKFALAVPFTVLLWVLLTNLAYRGFLHMKARLKGLSRK